MPTRRAKRHRFVHPQLPAPLPSASGGSRFEAEGLVFRSRPPRRVSPVLLPIIGFLKCRDGSVASGLAVLLAAFAAVALVVHFAV